MTDRRTVLLHLAGAFAFAATASAASQTSAYDFAFHDIDGGAMPLSRFKGHAILVVNTASRCAYTDQYDALQDLYDTYRDRGLVVLGVPSDDFGGQELENEAAVKAFCKVNFNLDFPLTSITRVRGGRAHPFYRWAREELGRGKAPAWNFHKYLVNREGRLVDAYRTAQEPMSRKVREGVEAVLSSGDGG